MNTQDDHFAPSARDLELLAAVDRVLAQPGSATTDDPRSFEGYCAHLAGTVPQANPAFYQELERRLAAEIVHRKGHPGIRTRILSPLAGRLQLHLPWPAARLRLASLVLALIVAVGGAGGYLHGQGATPVDARTLLHRAETASPGPNEAVHEIYRLSVGGVITGSTEVWIGTDSSGLPAQIALTQTALSNGGHTSVVTARLVQTNPMLQVYDPANDTVTQSYDDRSLQSANSAPGTSAQDLEGMLVGTMVAQKLSRALANGMQPDAFKLEQQTLDGVPVFALTLDAGGQTFYFNTQSYSLEGADWNQAGRSWQARLDPASYQTMPSSAVPSGTFTLNAPASAHVVVLAPASDRPKGSGVDTIVTAMAAACHTTAQAVSTAMQQSKTSLLAVCQQTAPTMTADDLVAALLAPFKARLDAQVASGAITAADEATDLANLRTKLTAMVTGTAKTGPGKIGSGPGGKNP